MATIQATGQGRVTDRTRASRRTWRASENNSGLAIPGSYPIFVVRPSEHQVSTRSCAGGVGEENREKAFLLPAAVMSKIETVRQALLKLLAEHECDDALPTYRQFL